MKVIVNGFCLSIFLLAAACGVKQGSAGFKGDSPQDAFGSIGRGTKLTLLKDLEIPANQSQVMIGPVESYSKIEGEGNTVRKTYLVCGISARETSLDRRVLKVGSVIELNGESTSIPNGENSSFNIEAVGISNPSPLEVLGCMKLVSSCWEGVCDQSQQVSFKVQDFETVLKGLATIERAASVVIPSN